MCWGSPHLLGRNCPSQVRVSCKQDGIFLVAFLLVGAGAGTGQVDEPYEPGVLILQADTIRAKKRGLPPPSQNHTGHPADLRVDRGDLERMDMVSGVSSSLHGCLQREVGQR